MIRKIGYSIGALALGFAAQVFSAYVIFFYVDVNKLPVYLAGTAMLIYAGWNAASHPLAGFLSDWTRSRRGRRRSYLAAALLPFGLVFYLLWVPPFLGLEQYKFLFAYFLLMICLFDGLYAVIGINWSSLFPEMFRSLKERLEVNSYRQTFGLLGLMFGLALPPLFYGVWGWGWLGALGGLAIMLGLLLVLFASGERQESGREKRLPLRQALKATLTNGSFLIFAAANFFVQFSLLTLLAAIPFFAKYVISANTQLVAVVLAAACCSAVIALFLWRLLAVRIGAKRVFLSALLLLAAVLQPLFLITSPGLILLDALLIGAALAGYLLAGDVLIAEIIDEDETRTGERREGAYFGTNTLISRLAAGLQAVGLSVVFVFCGYNPYVYTQPRGFETGLRLLIAGLPAAALLLGALIFLFWRPGRGAGPRAVRTK